MPNVVIQALREPAQKYIQFDESVIIDLKLSIKVLSHKTINIISAMNPNEPRSVAAVK
jgi:hypothetical protein